MKEIDKEAIGKRIQEMQAQLKKTNSEILNYIGPYTKSTWRSFKNGNRLPSIRALVGFSILYNCTLDYLVTGKDSDASRIFHQFLIQKSLAEREEAFFINTIKLFTLQLPQITITQADKYGLKDFGKRLQEFCAYKRIADQDLAKEAGLTKESIQRWKQGEGRFTLYDACDLTNYFQCGYDMLMLGYDRSFPLRYQPLSWVITMAQMEKKATDSKEKCTWMDALDDWFVELRNLIKIEGIKKYR